MSCLDFVSWLEHRLLSDDSTHASLSPFPPRTLSQGSADSVPAAPGDQVLDVMWCSTQQYSAMGVVFPCCVVLTTTKIIVERLMGSAGDGGFAGVPELRPCVILPLGSIQQVVVGPCHSYLRLEEAFVGKGGLFTLFALDTSVLKHFADMLKSSCEQINATASLDTLDLSLQSDLLTEVCHREEGLGLPSDRLAFTLLVKVKEAREVKPSLLVLSENIVYCLDTACVYWPPPTFQSAHEGAIHLKVLKEFSIMDHIVDLALHTSTQESVQGGKVDFTPISLSMQVKSPFSSSSSSSSSHQGELVFFFSTCSARDNFLDRLTNLRAEHAHRMSPSIREAPEGGNESLDVADTNVQPSPTDCSGSAGSSGSNGVSQKRARPQPPKVSITHPGSSLPSSFDWKGYYFNDTSESGTTRTDNGEVETEAAKTKEVARMEYLSDIQSSGEIEEAEPTVLEQELQEAVRTYELFHPMPARLRPISLMTGREVVAFFHGKIARSSSSSSASSPNESKLPSAAMPEELRHALWTTVVPYTDPGKEMVSLVMLSTRAVYLVSDSSASTSNPSARPSWMTHNRHKSDSAVGWQSSKSPSPKGSGQGGRWSKVNTLFGLLDVCFYPFSFCLSIAQTVLELLSFCICAGLAII